MPAGLRRFVLRRTSRNTLTPRVGRGGAVHIARTFMDRKRTFIGQRFWARGYFVLTVG